MTPKSTKISEAFLDTVCRRLSQNKRVRRTLPDQGRLHVDRQLPFLCVYRRPERTADPGTDRLVKGEAAYLVISGAESRHGDASRLVRRVVETLSAEFGAVLIVEIWAGSRTPAGETPGFQIALPPTARLTKAVEAFTRRLQRIKVLKRSLEVEIAEEGPASPPGMPPLLTEDEARSLQCSIVGLAVPPVYRDGPGEKEFPLVMRDFRRNLGLALKQLFYHFARSQTTHAPPHYHELGRRAVVKAVWEVDRQLGEVSNSFDFLLQLSPTNSEESWDAFERSRFERIPEFRYRPTPFDPALLKRQLYQIPIERVEDPALQGIFEEKRQELDRKITMLNERDTPRFLFGSIQLYGEVEPDLAELADTVLERLPGAGGNDGSDGSVDAEQFAEAARQEFAYYQRLHADFCPKVEVTRRVSGIMVSRGRLLVNRGASLANARVGGLLQHEVGTHLLTYYNGRAQPFRQLYSGLAGYESLQEGLAVLAEYLAGGLDRTRMRQLAGRVVAAKLLTEGASFQESFTALTERHGFPLRTAFRIVMRVYRGGGFTKDAVYLRGLRDILRYVQRGGDLPLLFVGKISAAHLAVVKELRYRKVLVEPPLVPRYMTQPEALQRLESLRGSSGTVLTLVEPLAERKPS